MFRNIISYDNSAARYASELIAFYGSGDRWFLSTRISPSMGANRDAAWSHLRKPGKFRDINNVIMNRDCQRAHGKPSCIRPDTGASDGIARHCATCIVKHNWTWIVLLFKIDNVRNSVIHHLGCGTHCYCDAILIGWLWWSCTGNSIFVNQSFDSWTKNHYSLTVNACKVMDIIPPEGYVIRRVRNHKHAMTI